MLESVRCARALLVLAPLLLPGAALAQPEEPAENPDAGEAEAPAEPGGEEGTGEEEAQPQPDEGVEVVVPEGEASGSDEGSGGEATPDVLPGPPDADEDEVTIEEDLEGAAELEGGEESEAEEGEESRSFYGSINGAFRFRLNVMSDIPLNPVESRGFPARLGQNFWAEQWFRFRGEIGIRPQLKVIGEIDLADGILFGESTHGVERAVQPRDDESAFGADGVDPRAAYLEWLSPIGLFRAGLMPSHWGLGILANDGDHEEPFGDYHYGDHVIRLAYATKPLGPDSPFVVALGGDLVFDDVTADITEGDRALQGILAAFYQQGERTLGMYLVYRSQRSDYDTGIADPIDRRGKLDVGVVDAYGQWDFEDPSGGRVFAALETAFIFGSTTLTIAVPDFDDGDLSDTVRQFMFAAQVGRRHEDVDVVLEAGYASGDSNTEDDYQRRATMDPDHRVGLIMFPEVLAWNTARSATLAGSPDLFGRPSPGSELLPTNGGVSGAFYLFPYVIYRPIGWLDLRLGGVWARASSDVVDPYRQRAQSRSATYTGGDARNRDLGVELDGAVLCRYDLPHGVVLTGGVEGGFFLPGRAFDDADGNTMDPVGLFRFRLGLAF